jgi:CheY-like chemotaxis protein
VAVIGKKWLTIKNKKGKRRLEDPEDYVRLEIAKALELGIPVIPVLVGGAQMPSASSLPDILQKLARRQAHSILDVGFKQSVSSLINTIQKQSKREQEATRKVPAKVLWVDDNPANNQALIERYRSRGIIFDLALNTKQALDFLAHDEYALIISDIGRGSDWEAGIDMIPQIRSRFPKSPPIIIHAHPKAVEAHAEKAKKLGASLVTASQEELIDWLEKVPV